MYIEAKTRLRRALVMLDNEHECIKPEVCSVCDFIEDAKRYT
jgi:hypothetical protein